MASAAGGSGTILMEARPDNIYSAELQGDSFRLLQIFSSRSSAPETLSCTLDTYPLTDCPSYVALSYAWDEEQAVGKRHGDHVVINGRKVAIRANLDHALHHLATRQQDAGPRHYWIDAICIDQSSDRERARQIARMHRIYRNAAHVLVWLGPDGEGEVYAIREFLRALLKKFYHKDDCSGGSVSARKYSLGFLHRDDEHALRLAGLPPLDDDIWRRVVRFWDRSWFSRVWVQQEVALARQARFSCGDVEFDQEELVETSRFFVVSGLGETLMLLRIDPESSRKSILGRKVGCSAVRIPDLQMWAAGAFFREAIDFCQAADRLTGPARKTEDGDVADPLLRIFAQELLVSSRDDASDQRDKIYALLVLMRHLSDVYGRPALPLEVDYSKTVDDVFREATACVIQLSGWLGILSLLHPGRHGHVTPTRPSWVPDYGRSPPRPLLLFATEMTDKIQKHSMIMSLATRPMVCETQLSVSVTRIGVVADIGDTYESLVEDGLLEKTARLLLECPSIVNNNGKTRIDMWMDVLSGECSPEPSSAERCASFKHWLTFFILRKLGQDFLAGRIKRGREHLCKMPSFERLAAADLTGTVPTWAYWSRILPDPTQTSKILEHRPSFETIELDSRRLFRLTALGTPCCPSATFLGIGPEDIRVDDHVCLVAGSAMPVVLRSLDDASINLQERPSLLRGVIVGEAYVSGLDDNTNELDEHGWERWQLQ